MSALILGPEELRQIIHRAGLHDVMDELIQRLEAALLAFDSEEIEVPIRSGFNYELPHAGLVEWMPLYQRGKFVTLKVVGYHPNNPQRAGMPSVLSSVTRYDTNTGQLCALIDGTFPTALRTAAASVVASRLLAIPSSNTLGFVGCGAQAVSQAHAMSRAFPLSKILYVDTDLDAQASFSRRLRDVVSETVELQAAPLEKIISDSDIVCTATSIGVGEGPLFENLPHKNHLHINAVGSDFPGKTELPLEFLERAVVCPDFLRQALHEGECQQLDAAKIGPDLATLIACAGDKASWQQQPSVFDSTGYALEDDVVMTLFLDLAERLNIGRRQTIESYASDPKDPYEFLGA